VFDVTTSGFEAIELAPGVTGQQVQERTEGALRFSPALAAHR